MIARIGDDDDVHRTQHASRLLAHMGSLQQAAYVRPIEY